MQKNVSVAITQISSPSPLIFLNAKHKTFFGGCAAALKPSACKAQNLATRNADKKKAFTLIELLVVVLIIGVLAAVALPQYSRAVEKSRAAEALVTLKAFVDSYKRYEIENGTYPTSFEDLDIDIAGTPPKTASGGEYKLISSNWRLLIYPKGVIVYSEYRNNEVKIWYRRSDKELICSTSKGKNDWLCRELGAKEFDPPITSCGWSEGDSCRTFGKLN